MHDFHTPYSTLATQPIQTASTTLALNEHELAARWRLSVKTLQRWRQTQLGPVFCKLGARVTYLMSDIEAYERKVARYSTAKRVHQHA